MPVRPDLHAKYQALLAEAEQHAKASQAPEAEMARFRAAAVFSGSRDPEELELRYQAMAEVANALRQAGRLPEAETAYERMGKAALTESGPEHRTVALADYFIGQVRSDRDDEHGAAAAYEKAYALVSKLPNEQNLVRPMASSLALSLIRDHQWARAITITELYAEHVLKDSTGASLLHNRALALLYGGQPAAAIEPIRAAIFVHTELTGANHPNTIESRLLEAQILAEAGKGQEALPLLQQAAAVILSGPGEGHAFFARALLTSARIAAYSSEGVAAEGLARRALYLLEQAGLGESVLREYRRQAAAIPPLWRTAKPAAGPEDVRLWRADLQHTLLRYQVTQLGFEPSGDRPKQWYFFVPAQADLTDPPTTLQLARLAFAGANEWLNSREPADPNVLDVTSVQMTELSVLDLLATEPKAFFPQRVWEAATAYSIVEGAFSLPLVPADFAEAVNAYAALRGGKPNLQSWLELGLDKASLERAVAEPAATLTRTLWREASLARHHQ